MGAEEDVSAFAFAPTGRATSRGGGGKGRGIADCEREVALPPSPKAVPRRSRQNAAVDRRGLIERARRANEEAGRGAIVMLLEDAEPRYVPVEELKASLAEARVEPDLLFGAVYAIRKYDPKWQAVLFLEQEECCTVTIVGYEKSEVVESVSWTPVN